MNKIVYDIVEQCNKGCIEIEKCTYDVSSATAFFQDKIMNKLIIFNNIIFFIYTFLLLKSLESNKEKKIPIIDCILISISYMLIFVNFNLSSIFPYLNLTSITDIFNIYTIIHLLFLFISTFAFFIVLISIVMRGLENVKTNKKTS